MTPPSSMTPICRRDFELDRLADETDRVDVLDLAPRAERLARATHRHVDVGPQAPLFHVAVAGAEIAQDRPELGQECTRLVGRAEIRLADDLHQRDPRPVEVDEAQRRVLVVDRLAGVLFEVKPLDADGDRIPVGQIDRHCALPDDRLLVLGDLIALRQIRIEVVLPIENASKVDLRLEPQPGAHRLGDALLVDHREHAGHRSVDQADMGVGGAAKRRRGAGKELGSGRDLRVDLHADHDLPVAGCPFDQFPLVDRSDVDVHGACFRHGGGRSSALVAAEPGALGGRRPVPLRLAIFHG